MWRTTTGRLTAHVNGSFPAHPADSRNKTEKMPDEGELNEPETSNGALFRWSSGRRRDLCSAEGHRVASLDSPARRTSPYTPTWTSLWRAAVRRIPLSFGRSPCGSVVMTQRGQWSVIASTTSSPIRSSLPTHLVSTNSASSFSGRTTMLGRKRLTSKRPCG